MKDAAEKMDAVERRRKSADMYLKGWSQESIASFLEVSQATVSRDLQDVRTDWRQTATFDFDEARAGQRLRTTMARLGLDDVGGAGRAGAGPDGDEPG